VSGSSCAPWTGKREEMSGCWACSQPEKSGKKREFADQQDQPWPNVESRAQGARTGWEGSPRGSSLRAGASIRPCVRFETLSRARIVSGRSARAPMEDVFAPVDCIGVRDVRGNGCGATAAGARSCAGVDGSAEIASM
jgi:hypothetical protein